MGQRIAAPGAPPFLVAERDGRVAAWARVSPTSSRECYAGVGEASIYVARGDRAAGVGRALLTALAEAAERAGYWKLVGLVFPTNAASVGLLSAAGFLEVGLHRRHGRLDGEWRDVLVLERLLGPAA
jgi:L-amino acid N-acyltransferase YncA